MGPYKCGSYFSPTSFEEPPVLCSTYLDLRPFGDVEDELDVGVVVVVGSSGDRDVLIGKADKLCNVKRELITW